MWRSRRRQPQVTATVTMSVPRTSTQRRHVVAWSCRFSIGLDTFSAAASSDWNVARAVLGHASPVVTEVYAEMDQAKASEAMGKID
ncbi:MAG: hypothetical protein ACXVBO_11870 [Isosphaeraceae bacterium]